MAMHSKIPPIPPRKSGTSPPIPSVPSIPRVPPVEDRSVFQREGKSFWTPTTWYEEICGPGSGPFHHLMVYGLFAVIALLCFAIAVATRSFLFFQFSLVAVALYATSFLGGLVSYVVSLLGTIGIGLFCFAVTATTFGFLTTGKGGVLSRELHGFLSFFVGGFGLLVGFFGLIVIAYGFFLLAPSQRKLFFEKQSKKKKSK